MSSITASALGPYRQFKAATFFSSSNRSSFIESSDTFSSSDFNSITGSTSPTSTTQRSSTRSQAGSSVRNMMVRSPSSAQMQLLEEQMTCEDKWLSLAEPRPYYAACNNIGEVLYSQS